MVNLWQVYGYVCSTITNHQTIPFEGWRESVVKVSHSVTLMPVRCEFKPH